MLPEPIQPLFLSWFFVTKKGKKGICFLFVYLRLLRTSAAAAITTTMTTAPIARYVAVGSAAVGGGAIEGAGVVVCRGAVAVG